MNWDFVKIVGIPNIGSAKLPDSQNWEDPNTPYPLQAYDQAFIVEGCYERFKGIQARPTGFVAGDEKISNAMRSSNMLHSASEIRRQILGISWIDPTQNREEKHSQYGMPTYDELRLRTPYITTDDIASFATGGPPTKQALVNVYKDLKRMWRKDFPFSINTDNLSQVHSNLQYPQSIVEGAPWAYCSNKAGRATYSDTGYFKRNAIPGMKLENIGIEDDRLYENIKVCIGYAIAMLAEDETHPIKYTTAFQTRWVDGAIQFDRTTGDFYVAFDESAYSIATCQAEVNRWLRGMGQQTNYTDEDGYVYDRTTLRCEFYPLLVHMDYKIKTKF